MAPILGNLRQSKKKSEIKPPLVTYKRKKEKRKKKENQKMEKERKNYITFDVTLLFDGQSKVA